MEDNRKRAHEILAGLDKGTRQRLLTGEAIDVERLETPSLGLTRGLNGGWAMGRQVMLWGPKSAGKSTLVMQQMAVAQRAGKVCAYFDAEKTYDPSWAKRLGVDIDELIVHQTGTMTAVANDAGTLMDSGVDVIAIDSISSLLPPTYLDKDGSLKPFEQTGAIGGFSRGMGPLVEQLSYRNNNTLLMMVSQIRMGPKGPMHWGRGPMGGSAVEHANSQSVLLSSTNSDDNTIMAEVKIGDRIVNRPVGRWVNWLVDKSKTGPERASGKYALYFDGDFVGVDTVGEMIEIGVEYGVIRKGGAWYYYGDDQLGQGALKAANRLREDESLYNEIKEKIYDAG